MKRLFNLIQVGDAEFLCKFLSKERPDILWEPLNAELRERGVRSAIIYLDLESFNGSGSCQFFEVRLIDGKINYNINKISQQLFFSTMELLFLRSSLENELPDGTCHTQAKRLKI